MNEPAAVTTPEPPAVPPAVPPMDILFYAIAIHGGYTTAQRTLTPEEIRTLLA